MPDLTADRLRLFAFTQAEHRERYLALLRAFDEAREQSRLQIGPTDVLGRVPDLDTTEAALAALDQLYDWGLVARLQDDRRIRTVAEYRQRRSVYQMTELGWLAWHAVEGVLAAEPGEAEHRRLVLPMVLEQLQDLDAAIERGDGERAGLLLEQAHDALTNLAHHAARFTLATSELSATWEADPAAFLEHKNRLLGHLDGFLAARSSLRPTLAHTVAALDRRRDDLVRLVAGSSPALDGRERAEIRILRRWQGVVSWFVDQPEQPSQAAQLEGRTSRAIRDLAVPLKRVLDATAGGISRATQLEELAAWFMACSEPSAHALAWAGSGLGGARHFGVPEADPDATEANVSWWEGPPAPVDTTLRKLGRASPPPPPKPVPDRRRERQLLREAQARARAADDAASLGLVHALQIARPLDEAEIAVLLRLLSRALHTRRPAAGTAHTVRGTLVLEGHNLQVTPSGAPA